MMVEALASGVEALGQMEYQRGMVTGAALVVLSFLAADLILSLIRPPAKPAQETNDPSWNWGRIA